jgi:hypothetical protein
MRKTRRILNIIIIVLLVFQLLGYLGNLNKESTKAEGVGLVAYYIGFNFAIILAGILFLISQHLKTKINKKEETDIIDSLGNN